MTQEIKAHVAGVVSAINVAAGDQVDDGDEVVVLESMKMQLPLTAPIRGTVSVIRVQMGELVQPGQVLLVLT
jgi:urea carboxylase